MKKYSSIREVKTLVANGTTTLIEVINDAVRFVNDGNYEAYLLFNGHKILILPGMTADHVYNEYHKNDSNQ